MVTRGLLVRLEARQGREVEVESFLQSALGMVQKEPGTIAWFGVRFGPREYGIIDVFSDDAARAAHLKGAVVQALEDHAHHMLVSPPRIQSLDVIADKLPRDAAVEVTKGIFLHFKPRAEHQQNVEEFLRNAQPLVEQERGTAAWFAIRIDNGEYGIFDVFPSNGARLAHLAGRVPRELAKHAFSLLGGIPKMEMPVVLAEKMSSNVSSSLRTV